MTMARPEARRGNAFASTVSRIRRSRLALWLTFAVVHVALGALVLADDGHFLGDVRTDYLHWAETAASGGHLVGVQEPWVYPIGALIPVMVPLAWGATHYGVLWVGMIVILNAVTVGMLSARRRDRRLNSAWWWLCFLLLLGPISITRIDAVAAALAIIAAAVLATHPRVAVILLTGATWVKVWPVTMVASLVIMLRHRVRTMAWFVLASVAIVCVPVAFGAGSRLLSFVGTQGSRGLQIESAAAMWWLWAAALHLDDAHVEYAKALNTFQVVGTGTEATALWMTAVEIVAVVAIALLGVRAARRHDGRALPALMLGMVTALIVFDKVASPQYMTWLAAPVVLGILVDPLRFRAPATLALLVAVLTQAFYPYLYRLVIEADPFVIPLLCARNLALCWLLGWSVVRLWKPSTSAPENQELSDTAVTFPA